ncbi:12483_t:CDS:2, partial [Gigaspora rosea]
SVLKEIKMPASHLIDQEDEALCFIKEQYTKIYRKEEIDLEELKQTGDDDSTVMKWGNKLIKLKKLKNVKKCNDKDVMRLNVDVGVLFSTMLDDVSGKIDHPNVLKVFGLTYDLHHYLRQTALSKSPLSWNNKLELVRQIVVGLKCLYDQSIVHAELHSCNIFVNDGVPKLANVAISK